MGSLFSPFSKKSNKRSARQPRNSEEGRQGSLPDSSDSEDKLLPRDWDAEFLKAEEMLKDFDQENPAISTLTQKAHAHMNAAKTARDLSMFSQATDHLAVLKEMWESIGVSLYLAEVRQAGVDLRAMRELDKKNLAFLDNDRILDVFKEDFLHDPSPLVLLAVCMDAARKFPHLSVGFKLAVEKKEKGREQRYREQMACIVIGERMYEYYRDRDGRYFGGSNKICWMKEKDSFDLVVVDGQYRETPEEQGQERYRFSLDELQPNALGCTLPKKPFVMPNIIMDALKAEKEEFSLLCATAFLASSLGLEKLVEVCAEQIIKNKIETCLREQGISGEFLSSSRQKKLVVSFFIPALRNVRLTLDPRIFQWLEKLRGISVSLDAADVVLEPVDKSLLFHAGIEKYKKWKGYDFEYKLSCFLRIGPWLFNLKDIPSDNKAELVNALPHSVRTIK